MMPDGLVPMIVQKRNGAVKGKCPASESKTESRGRPVDSM